MNIRYIVIAETGSWGAAKTLRKAFSRAHLIEHTALSFFEHSIYPDEFAENWRSWREWGADEYRHATEGGAAQSVRVVIYPLDLDEWESWNVCSVTGGLSAIPADAKTSDAQATKRLREIAIKAQWINGAIKPIDGASHENGQSAKILRNALNVWGAGA